MLNIHKRLTSVTVRQGTVLILLVLFTFSVAWAISNWGDAPAELTISEYLNLEFKLAMNRPESNALNSFSLVSFYPSPNPQSALVFIIQTWHDERLQTQDLRREIRSVGEVLSDQFEAMVNLPIIKKRWNVIDPKTNIMVRHVRISDLRETLAVTFEGETLFDEKSITKAKSEAIIRGAVWGW